MRAKVLVASNAVLFVLSCTESPHDDVTIRSKSAEISALQDDDSLIVCSDTTEDDDLSFDVEIDSKADVVVRSSTSTGRFTLNVESHSSSGVHRERTDFECNQGCTYVAGNVKKHNPDNGILIVRAYVSEEGEARSEYSSARYCFSDGRHVKLNSLEPCGESAELGVTVVISGLPEERFDGAGEE